MEAPERWSWRALDEIAVLMGSPEHGGGLGCLPQCSGCALLTEHVDLDVLVDTPVWSGR